MGFFEARREPAVVKHGLLRRYCPAFVGKAGLRTGGRVMFLDGYAGAGSYDDGKPASPLILAELARNAVGDRVVEAIFVERNADTFSRLEQVLADHCRDQEYQALCGDIDEHLDTITARCKGKALFAFFDPFGPALGRDHLSEFLQARNEDGAPTDVLLHVSVTSVWRFGSRLTKARREDKPLTPSDDALMRHLDQFLGGKWWRPEFERAGQDISDEPDGELQGQRPADIALKVTQQYAQSLAAETGYRAVSVPVRRRPHHAPIFTLTLLTRHGDGLWLFADSIGKAGLDWQKAWREAEASKEGPNGQATLFADPADTVFDPADFERRNADDWVSSIASNIEGLLDRHGSIALQDHVVEVFGKTWGVGAQEKHVRKAVKYLHREGLVDHSGVGRYFYRETMSRPAS